MGSVKDYWRNPNKYRRRNAQILEDKRAGMSDAKLVTKYKLSPTRIQQICKKLREKERLERLYRMTHPKLKNEQTN
jgi:Mor family transcriptional regulator